MQLDERHAGEEGVIRSDLAEMIDRASTMSAYAFNAFNAFNAVGDAGGKGARPFPDGLAERLAEQTYIDILRYSLDECSCPCHQDHPSQP